MTKGFGQVEIQRNAIWTGNDVVIDIEVDIYSDYLAEGEVVGIKRTKIEKLT